MHLVARLTAAAAAVALLAACGSPAKTQVPKSKSSGSSVVVETSAHPSPSSEVLIGKPRSLDISFWYREFKVTLKKATVGILPEQPSYDTAPRLSLDAEFENVADDTHSFNPELHVASSENNYTAVDFAKCPPVPGKSKGLGTIIIRVDDKYNPDSAVLTVGNGKENQAVVPLGKSGTLKSLQPQTFPVSGSITAGFMTLTVTGGGWTYDRDIYNNMDAGHVALFINYSATKTKDDGSPNLSPSEFFLKLPDGTAVAAIDGSSASVQNGTTKQDLMIRFDVKQPVQGAFDLVLKGSFGANYGASQGDLQFTINPGLEASPAASSSPPSSDFFATPSPTPSGH